MEDKLAAAFDAFDTKMYKESLDKFLHAIDNDLSLNELVSAYNYIGYIYEMHSGASPDYKQAAMWYEKAAKLDDADGQFMLGQISRRNFNDYKDAIFWYKKAADKNYSPALYQLGIAFDVGDIIEKDQEKAERYLQRAAKSGHFLSRAVIARKSLRGQYGILGVIHGLFELFCLPVNVFLTKRANVLDERLR